MTVDATSKQWWDDYDDVVWAEFARFISDESNATAIKAFHGHLIDGLFQTQRYAEAVIRTIPLQNRSPKSIERLVAVRLRRQWQVLERAHRAPIEVVLDEAVLRRAIGGREVLREQLQHLMSVARQPGIDLYILPFTAGYFPAVDFYLHRSEQYGRRARWSLYTENELETVGTRDDPFVVELMLMLWEKIRQHSLDSDASLCLIEQVIRQLDNDMVLQLPNSSAAMPQ